jgi:17beta-estradiol 17-dehydrogenase / very-long-chain 3-oxoacyl-CoA reductase
MIIPRPAQYVKSVLAKIGLPCGAAYSGRPNTSTPYWSHALLDFAINLVGAKSLVIRYTHWFHKDIRRRALRKAEREAKKA